MGKIYSKAKKIYFVMHTIPILGRICTQLAPFAQKILRKLDFKLSISNNNTHQHIEILSHGLISLQKSIKTTNAQLESKVEEYYTQMLSYRDRLEFIRLEILEEYASNRQTHIDASSTLQPQILNQEKYNAALVTNAIRLNIGCGYHFFADSLNVDRRNLPGVDIVADAGNLPFTSGVICEIYAAHLMEHFTNAVLKNKLFPYWLDMLAQDGILKIIVPDMPAMISAYINGEMAFSDLREVTFGAQDYGDDFHYTMFSSESLKSILLTAGFKYVEIIDANRKNGKCREMEIWARKF